MANKSINAHFYFDLEIEDGTPDEITEEMFEQALELISEEFYLNRRKKKMETNISGNFTYVVYDDEDDEYQAMKDSELV
jgi:hypothetical protein